MLTTTKTTPEVAPVQDAEASPLTTAEANALLTMAAQSERKPSVKAGSRVERHWRQTGQVD